jgi:hypothetical protein
MLRLTLLQGLFGSMKTLEPPNFVQNGSAALLSLVLP